MGIHIELNNPNRSYFAGHIVDGRVVINNAKSDKAKGVTILLEGKGRVHWTEKKSETVYSSDNSSHTRTRTVHHTAEEIYVSYITPLVGDGVHSIMLPEGIVAYPFSFLLPNNIPSSFMSKIGQVSYQLKAKIKKSLFKFNDKSSLPFTVNGILDLNLEAGASKAQQFTAAKGPNFCACRKGQLGFVLSLPQRSGFVPGGAIELLADITNSSNKNINEVKAYLQQVNNFYARKKSKTETKIICQMSGPAVEKGEHEMWPAKLNIPALPPTRLGGSCRIIDVQYYLHFEMKISGWSSSLRGKLPVIIGTIPLRSTFGEFWPGYINDMPFSSHKPIEPEDHPEMGFSVPDSTVESKPSNQEDKPDASLNDPKILNVSSSVPLFQEYPDLPHVSYGSSISSPSAPSWDKFVPNYITYKRRM